MLGDVDRHRDRCTRRPSRPSELHDAVALLQRLYALATAPCNKEELLMFKRAELGTETPSDFCDAALVRGV